MRNPRHQMPLLVVAIIIGVLAVTALVMLRR